MMLRNHGRAAAVSQARALARAMARPARTLAAIATEVRSAWRISGGGRSFRLLVGDALLYRVLLVIDIPSRDRIGHLRGAQLRWRLNRGDIQSIREVWYDECYRLPFEIPPRVLVDLGANIGLTSVWISRHYGVSWVVAVEPVPSNVRLLRENFARNRVPGVVLEAAVGARDETRSFVTTRESNLGHLGSSGKRVRALSMATILDATPDHQTDLLKVDIEGGEAELLSGDLSWLQRVGSVVIEFHPGVVDVSALVLVFVCAGFRYIPAGTAWRGSMDAFVRDGWRTEHGELAAPSALTTGPAVGGRR